MKKIGNSIIYIIIILGIPVFTIYSLSTFSLQVLTKPNFAQNFLLVLLSLFEAFVFWVGLISMSIFIPIINKLSSNAKVHARVTYYPLLWMLMSWWPHDWFHAHNDLGTWGLIYIEYGFHFTSMIAALISIYGLSKLFIDFFSKEPSK